jgi:hypothetical protein
MTGANTPAFLWRSGDAEEKKFYKIVNRLTIVTWLNQQPQIQRFWELDWKMLCQASLL